MNKTFLAAVALGMALSSAAIAKPNLGGGFTGPSADAKTTTVEEAKKLNDDAHVVMRGNIKQNIGHEKYLFEDQTGSIVVEIDDDDWNGVTVGAEDLVEIRGEVDTHWSKPTDIDVETVTVITK